MLEDSIDMFNSTTWIELKEIIDKRIEISLNKLAHAKDFNEVLKLQGHIEALRSLRALEIKQGD